MVLGEVLESADGLKHKMLDLLPLHTSFAHRKMHLGYRQIRLRKTAPFCDAGDICIGHEFHYATILSAEGESLADMTDGLGECLGPVGTRVGQVTGSFVHIIAHERDPLVRAGTVKN